MEELEYPFDPKEIIAKRKKYRRILLENKEVRIRKKIAILGGFTTSDIKYMLELFLLNYGIEPYFYESEYNRYYEDALFGNEQLNEFEPDVIYICTSSRNISVYPGMGDTPEHVQELLAAQMDKYETIWDNLGKKYWCPVIQNNFEMPFYRLLGNKDASDIHGKTNYITRLNLLFYEYAQKHDNFYICDINYLSADYGLKEWADPFYWYMYKYALNVNAIPYLSFNVANIIKSLFGKNKKGLVLDLDQTLWGGVIGDDGVHNLRLGPEEPEGQAYAEFQRYVKEHMQLGILLNINSKNEYVNALNGLRHPDSELSEQDFISIKANWNPKDRNFKEIADELNLLPESLLFVDDNPAERHLVTKQQPGVSAPDIGEVTQYIIRIDRGGYFETTVTSEDDSNRIAMYRENAARVRQRQAFSDYGEYLDSLEMTAVIRPFEPIYFARIAQLTNKSNQFNLTTRRYTQMQIEAVASDPSYVALYGKLSDKFGDNGVVSVVIGRMEGQIVYIDLWIMSCRVLKREMEFAMMDVFVEKCMDRHAVEIVGFYYPTEKNGMVRDFYEQQGFEKESEDEMGNAKWRLKLGEQPVIRNRYIKVEG